MPYNYGFGSGGSSSGGGGGSASTEIVYGRVIDVVLDGFNPLFNEYQKSQSINGVLFRPLKSQLEEDESEPLKFAYCANPTLRRVPLKNEIVRVISMPAEYGREADSGTLKNYWIDIVPLWNHPHHNAYPDVLQFIGQESKADLGDYFEESGEIPPLQIFPGDVIIEGRHGNSIRLGGAKYDSNEITEDSNNGKPYILISNGQAEPENGIDPIIEDINEDPTSIYLGSDHTFKLEQANEKRDAWEEEPEKADVYKGAQVIVNSGRLFFNAKEEGVFISATEGIGLNGEMVGIDGEKYVALDAKKIYLGTEAFGEREPVLLGQTSIDWLDDFVSQFETVVKGMATLPPAPPAAVAKLIATGNAVLPVIPQLKQLLKQLLSKKVYTE